MLGKVVVVAERDASGQEGVHEGQEHVNTVGCQACYWELG